MADGTTRRPLPALICLLALLLLTALVWWRVLNRHDSSTAASGPCPSTSASMVLPRPQALSVTVYNSTNRAQLAKKTAAVLTKDGFTVSGYGNDTGHAPVTGVAEIRFSQDQQPGADLLGYYFHGATMVPLPTTTDSVLIVALGAKFVAVSTPTAVQSAITGAHASQAPTSSPAGGLATPSC